MRRLIVLAASLLLPTLAHAQDAELFDHNGSQMSIHYDEGSMRYQFPKANLRGVVDQYQAVFTGEIKRRGKVTGVAYAFKKGCEFAQYPVTGAYDPTLPGYVLTGNAPIREKAGCRVVGYTSKSPNARLVFVDLTEQYNREQDAAAQAIYEDESDPNWSAGFIYPDDPVKKRP